MAPLHSKAPLPQQQIPLQLTLSATATNSTPFSFPLTGARVQSHRVPKEDPGAAPPRSSWAAASIAFSSCSPRCGGGASLGRR